MDLDRYIAQLSNDSSKITLTKKIHLSNIELNEYCQDNIEYQALNELKNLTGGGADRLLLKDYFKNKNPNRQIINLVCIL
jgi:hypothetical protein